MQDLIDILENIIEDITILDSLITDYYEIINKRAFSFEKQQLTEANERDVKNIESVLQELVKSFEIDLKDLNSVIQRKLIYPDTRITSLNKKLVDLIGRLQNVNSLYNSLKEKNSHKPLVKIYNAFTDCISAFDVAVKNYNQSQDQNKFLTFKEARDLYIEKLKSNF